MNNETRLLLKMRATSMASATEIRRDSETDTKIVVFRLAHERYGIESAYVREVYPLKDLTPLPGIPSFIAGIVNVRGRILPVVDLKKFFNLPGNGLRELDKLIIIYDVNMEFGILADEVEGTKVICIEELLATPGTEEGIVEKYIKGITKDHLILLSANRLLSDKSIKVYEEVTN
jgi:purine-binding chemotaxis protein CheW